MLRKLRLRKKNSFPTKKKKTCITMTESQLVTMVMFNLAARKKVSCTVPLTQRLVLIYLHMTKE